MKSARAGIVAVMTRSVFKLTSVFSFGIAAALTGCQEWLTPIPISPFESHAKDSAEQMHGEPQLQDQAADSMAKSKLYPQAVRPAAPKVSMFMVRWSLPASANDIKEFRLDYGVNPKSLDNSVKLHRRDLESNFAPGSTAVIFKHPISIPGIANELSVKVSAISDTGAETPSAVFTSKRIGESPSP